MGASGQTGEVMDLPTLAVAARICEMKLIPRCLLIVAMTAAPLVNGDGVADLVGRAENGDALAQFELGEIYAKGEGVTKDVVEAVKWLTKAAEQGNDAAQMKLGGIYIGGRGVPKHSAEAAKWFMMSAEKGNSAAQCQVARMHLTGAGVPKDDVDAYKWSILAATQGDSAAKKILAFVLIRMTPAQITEGKRRAQEFLDSRRADKSLDLPPQAPEMPNESLPLFSPE